MTVETDSAHAARMDAAYRHQKHIYDLSRKYFLLGRDGLIDGLDVPAGATCWRSAAAPAATCCWRRGATRTLNFMASISQTKCWRSPNAPWPAPAAPPRCNRVMPAVSPPPICSTDENSTGCFFLCPVNDPGLAGCPVRGATGACCRRVRPCCRFRPAGTAAALVQIHPVHLARTVPRRTAGRHL